MVEKKVYVKDAAYPQIGLPREPRPYLAASIYESRLARTRQGMAARGLDAMVVYGDREHYGTIHYLTNYDPRFEETLLIIHPTGTPVLLVGNEGMGYSTVARLGVRLYQTLSLLGQPRDKVRPLEQILREAGLKPGMKIGSAGWKYFDSREFADPQSVLDLPDFLAQPLRRAVGPGGTVSNHTDLFMAADAGLRNICEVEQLAEFEWIATLNSQTLLQGMGALRVGMTERELFTKTAFTGDPVCCYSCFAAGENTLKHGFPSPTDRPIARGEAIFMSYSYQGANTCRFGWVAAGPQDLPAPIADYAERVAAPYFRAMAAWYQALRVGATGNDLHHAVVDRLTPHNLRVGLNIGHQIAFDEWTHSLVEDGSTQQLRSGMYLQADFFAMSGTPHHGAFAEDGVAVADGAMRQQLSGRFPQMWRRIQQRRAFMKDQLGIALHDDVLPLSNFPAAIIPYFLAPMRCMAYAG